MHECRSEFVLDMGDWVNAVITHVKDLAYRSLDLDSG